MAALYEYFQNRNLNAESGTQGGKPAINPRYDNNRYGGQIGGPILRDKLFFFANFERNTIGQNPAIFSCAPTAAGLSMLNSLGASYDFNANNLAQYLKFTPAATVTGPNGGPINASQDQSCGNSSTGPQYLAVYQGTAFDSNERDLSAARHLPPTSRWATTRAPRATPANFDVLTTSMDYTISSKDNFRGRYIYNRLDNTDNATNSVPFPIFNTLQPFRLSARRTQRISHLYTQPYQRVSHRVQPLLTTQRSAGNFTYPGLDVFPNLVYDDQGFMNLGPDPNAPQFTIQNLYQLTDNVNYVKGRHTFTIGFDGRKYISPQGFTQRSRGDYEWDNLTEFLHDLAPTSFGERSTGNRHLLWRSDRVLWLWQRHLAHDPHDHTQCRAALRVHRRSCRGARAGLERSRLCSRPDHFRQAAARL